MLPTEISECIKRQSAELFQRASKRCDELTDKAKAAIENYAKANGVSIDNICFTVVGSVGRGEALEASDFDLTPIARDDAALAAFMPHDQAIRQELIKALGVKVSKGEDLTKPVAIASLIERESIGGPKDTSASLTKRMLILTESRQVTGGLDISEVRQNVLQAYGDQDRTSGRHTLSLCNDIARYYRTLCIEYKAKADEQDTDWCTRNLKLRHSRKFWYFANIIAIVKLAETHPRGQQDYNEELLALFNKPPIVRVGEALRDTQAVELGRLLESYSLFLEFMSNADNRKALASIAHEARYEPKIGNPFPAMKFNSDLLHKHMMQIIDALPRTTRQRVYDWFLF